MDISRQSGSSCYVVKACWSYLGIWKAMLDMSVISTDDSGTLNAICSLQSPWNLTPSNKIPPS